MSRTPPVIKEQWDTLSAWLTAWMHADVPGRARLRAELDIEHPDLAAAADTFADASAQLDEFLETPALVVAARALAADEGLLPAGATIGPYRVAGLLARGGMGDVYRATDLRLHRDVALKVLTETRTNDPHRLERFTQEAAVTASLEHPNVVRVYDVGCIGGRAYLVAELLEGETLRERIARGPMPLAEVLLTAAEIVSGLGAAHEAGLVHRDLKPENIFLTRAGTAKILDFGIAKLAQDETVGDGRSTLTGVVLGTAGYLAPEQIRGERVDARADLFAVGVVLFEALTGTRAFARAHLVETLYAILHEPPADALARRDDVPPAMVDVVMRLMEKSPEARYQSCAELSRALGHITTSDDGRESATRSVMARARAQPRRARWLAGAVGLAAAVGLMMNSYLPRSPAVPPAETSQPTLAVMPFRSIPGGSGDGLLEVGLADVFVSRLARLSEIRVLPLAAVERVRSAADHSMAVRGLGATHLLTGTIQRDRDQVRATVQLLATADNRTIWSSPIDTDASSVFSIQDIIVTRVIGELAPRLAAGTRRSVSDPGTRNNEAFEAYLRGRVFAAKATRAELLQAIAFFTKAVKLDDRFTDAWAGLATTYRRLPVGGDVPPGETFENAKRAANEALRLDPDHAEGHAALGTVAFWYEWDYPRAERLLRRGLDLQPSSADTQLFLAHVYSNLGRHDEALEGIRRARAFDPDWPVPRSLEGQFLFMAKRYEESLERLDALVAVEPGFATGHVMRMYPLLSLGRYDEAIRADDRAMALRRELGESQRFYSWGAGLRGYALARSGRITEAERILDQFRAHAGRQYVSAYAEALVLHGLGRDSAALEKLQKAVTDHDHRVTFLGVDPKWDGLRHLHPFQDLLARVNLLEVSRAGR